MKKQTLSVLLLLLVLLLLFTILAVTSMPAVTYDEPNYVTAGYSYYKTRDYRLNFEHPPLAKLIAGFPLFFINPEIDFTLESWETATNSEAAYVMQWYFSKDFFYYSNNDPEQLLFYSRIPFILLGILLGIYVFRWATMLYGNKAGLLALFLYALSPNMIAYTQLTITDFALTTFFFITLYYFWRWQETKTTADVIRCSVFLGLSLATKLTAVYLVAILALLIILRRDKKEIMTDGTYLIGMIIIACTILSVTYLFINTPQYIEAIKLNIIHSNSGHPSYLLGEYGTHGWWYYFIVVFLVKTPLATIVLLLASILWFKRIKHSNIYYEYILIVPPLFYFAMSMLNNINIGIRHILPIYPFLFVFCSKIINLTIKAGFSTGENTSGFAEIFRSQWKITRKLKDRPERSEHTIRSLTGGGRSSVDRQYILYITIAALCLWYAASSLLIYPHYLSYFNEFAGGPDHGQEILLDSNIDWGQEMNRLDAWLAENNRKNQTIYFSVFTVEPLEYTQNHRKIQATAIKCAPHPGFFVVSINRLYDFAQTKQGCLDWLKEREPDAKIGYSIFIYNITDPELIEQETYCTAQCTTICEEDNKVYRDYLFMDECICACE